MTSSLEQEKRKRPYFHHPFEERNRVVELYKSGLGCKLIARETGLDDSMVRKWLRKYKASGVESLRPLRGKSRKGSVRELKRADRELLFSEAYIVYSMTLEPAASIARRFRLDYRTFRYHILHYHPELVASRTALRGKMVDPVR